MGLVESRPLTVEQLLRRVGSNRLLEGALIRAYVWSGARSADAPPCRV
jgi:hypothetical protein